MGFLSQRLVVLSLSSIFIYSTCYASSPSSEAKKFNTIKILSINDFHGQISTGRMQDNRHIGSAPVLAAYLKKAQQEMEKNTLIAFTGDQVGASPPASGLLHDQPTILFLNSLGNRYCTFTKRMDPRCNLVGNLGNHEFDQGRKVLTELLDGTQKPPVQRWINSPSYPGTNFPYISANILDKASGKPIFPPYVIKEVNGLRIAFIGAILSDAPAVIMPQNRQGIQFIDEAEAVNRYIPEIKAQKVSAIVVLLHQGGFQASYTGKTKSGLTVLGPINEVVKRLDNAVDVVLAGHTHQFTNAFLKNQQGKSILVTQANSYSAAFAEVTLTINPKTSMVVTKSARIITTFADQDPGLKPDSKALRLTKLAEKAAAPIVNKQMGKLANNLLRKQNQAGESNLGDLSADAFRVLSKADIAMINPGGLRADIFKGPVTWGDLYAAQPFGNVLIVLEVRGQTIYEILEQQWSAMDKIILQISGFTYQYDDSKPIGSRVVGVYRNNERINKNEIYTLATNNFLAGGGDNFTKMKEGKVIARGESDLSLLINYIQSLPQPFSVVAKGRIQKLN